MIAPCAWLGVLGGGQLARMFAMAAHRLGYRVASVDPDPECPAAGVVDRFLCADLGDETAAEKLASLCAAVTVETENVPPETVEAIALRIPVAPDATALRVAQRRDAEKRFFGQLGLRVAPYLLLATPRDAWAPEVAALLPGLIKSVRFGYDGKGQIAVAHRADVISAYRELGGPCLLEKRLALEAELSVILARSADGRMAAYPVAQNVHVNGILDCTLSPATVPGALTRTAVRHAQRIAEALEYRGVLCVEFFVSGGKLLVNEMAPRPHNSGHFTIDACHASQFEQQVRVLAGLPLGDPDPVRSGGSAAMVNLLGDLWANGEPSWERVLAQPGARLHLYGKRLARPGRKMGHLTCLAESPEQALQTVRSLRASLRGRPERDHSHSIVAGGLVEMS